MKKIISWTLILAGVLLLFGAAGGCDTNAMSLTEIVVRCALGMMALILATIIKD
jgi:hypothetical protein